MRLIYRSGLTIVINLLAVTTTLAISESPAPLTASSTPALSSIPPAGLPIKKIAINDHIFKVEVASSRADLQNGLMNRQNLPADHGMLFVFPKLQQIAFWMKDTPLSLDVIFIDDQNVIKWIYPKAEPLSEQRIACPEDVKMMLEIPGGMAAKLQIKIGDYVTMDYEQQNLNRERQVLIEKAWENRDKLSIRSQGEEVAAILAVLEDLDQGAVSVAEKQGQEWKTHEWIKKAVLLSFRLKPLELVEKPVFGYDKVASKFASWTEADFNNAGLRVVPGAIVRHSAYIERNVVLMPSFTNVGARIGEGTMVDIWATVGSCAQIGAHCHISAGVIIGGVLEPIQAQPVIIEDNCFIGTQSAVVEGVIVEQGSVIGMGVMLGASTPIVDRVSGEIYYGRVPAYSVVIPGVMPAKDTTGVQTPCAVIVKRVDAKTRSKTGINELLRL